MQGGTASHGITSHEKAMRQMVEIFLPRRCLKRRYEYNWYVTGVSYTAVKTRGTSMFDRRHETTKLPEGGK